VGITESPKREVGLGLVLVTVTEGRSSLIWDAGFCDPTREVGYLQPITPGMLGHDSLVRASIDAMNGRSECISLKMLKNVPPPAFTLISPIIGQNTVNTPRARGGRQGGVNRGGSGPFPGGARGGISGGG